MKRIKRGIKSGGNYEDIFGGQQIIGPPQITAGNKLTQLTGGAILQPINVPYSGGEQLGNIHQNLVITAQQAGENGSMDKLLGGKVTNKVTNKATNKVTNQNRAKRSKKRKSKARKSKKSRATKRRN